MSPRLAGSILALMAAALLGVSIVTSAWWAGPPEVDGRAMHKKEVFVGLTGAEGCNTGGDGSCKPLDVGTAFEVTSYTGAAIFILLVAGLVVLAVLTLQQSEHRKRAAQLVLIGAGVATALAVALLVQGPTLVAGNREITVPIGYSMYVFWGGLVLAAAGTTIARRPAPKLALRGARPSYAPGLQAPPAQPPVDVLAMLSEPEPVAAPSAAPPAPPPPVPTPPPAPPPFTAMPAVPPSPGGELPGPAGPLRAPRPSAPPAVLAGAQLRAMQGSTPDALAKPSTGFPVATPPPPGPRSKPASVAPPIVPPAIALPRPRTASAAPPPPATKTSSIGASVPPPRSRPPTALPPPNRSKAPSLAPPVTKQPTIGVSVVPPPRITPPPPIVPFTLPTRAETEPSEGFETIAREEAQASDERTETSAPIAGDDVETLAREKVDPSELETVGRPRLSPSELVATVARESASEIDTIARERVSASELGDSTSPGLERAKPSEPDVAVAAPNIPVSTAPASLPPPSDQQAVAVGPSPACPQCEAPMAWVEEHLRFYCRSCRMYF